MDEPSNPRYEMAVTEREIDPKVSAEVEHAADGSSMPFPEKFDGKKYSVYFNLSASVIIFSFLPKTSLG